MNEDTLQVYKLLATASTPGPLSRAVLEDGRHVVLVGEEANEGDLVVAVTGDGPNSEANAIFFAGARRIVLELIDAYEENLRDFRALLDRADRQRWEIRGIRDQLERLVAEYEGRDD